MMPEERLVVTVDGLAASGKSALARGLAERFELAHLNTGLLYRAVAWLATQQKISLDDHAALVDLIAKSTLRVDLGPSKTSQVWNGSVLLGEQLQREEISRAASVVASVQPVRAALLPVQREAFPGSGLIAEGRDTGTVVFPDAQVKFFVQAEIVVRAKRRAAQLQAQDVVVDVSKIEHDLDERDRRDASREVAPMKPAADAVMIDNSAEPFNVVLDRMTGVVEKYLSSHSA